MQKNLQTSLRSTPAPPSPRLDEQVAQRVIGSSSAVNIAGGWTNRRLAHKWDTGWEFATFRASREGKHWAYYASVRRQYAHALDLSMYGIDKVWVVIAKEGT